MGRGDRRRHVSGHREGFRRREGAFLQPLSEGPPFEELHGEVGHAFVLPHLVDGDDALRKPKSSGP